MYNLVMPTSKTADRKRVPSRDRKIHQNPNDLSKCRCCGCSEMEPCNPPCGWARGKGNLCTSCDDLAGNIREWMEEVAVAPNLAQLTLEVLELRDVGKAPKVKRAAAGAGVSEKPPRGGGR